MADRSEARIRHERASASESKLQCDRASWRTAAKRGSGMSVRRIALVGAGVIGRHHGLVISQLADRLQLAAVADIQVQRPERLAAERGGRPFATLTPAPST